MPRLTSRFSVSNNAVFPVSRLVVAMCMYVECLGGSRGGIELCKNVG
jgi:hypothetical protein